MKGDLLQLLKQLESQIWKNLGNLDPQFRLNVALKLLKLVDWVHMGNGPDQNKLYREAENIGIHIKRPHFYSPLPILNQLPNYNWDKKWDKGINWNENGGLQLLEELTNYSSEYNHIIDSHQFDIIDQNQFKHLDSALYYAIIRHFKPRTIIEVGAGHSTRIASLACLKNSLGKIIAVEPYPPEFLRGVPKLMQLLDKPVQEISVDFFKQLDENDILFIDGSHVCKIGSDVNYLFLEVIPQLKKGVLIHIHDIFLPLEMPRAWIKELNLFWNEQYLLHAFLVGNIDIEVLMGNSYMATNHPEKIARLFDQSNKYNGLAGGSFWMRKKS